MKHAHDTAVIRNDTPSRSTPTAANGHVVFAGRVYRATVMISFVPDPVRTHELAELFRELDDLRLPPPQAPRYARHDLRADETRSNKDGGVSHGLPSYTARRFAPASRSRQLSSAPQAAPTPARARTGRDASRRRKRSRDFARTGRRTPWQSR